MAGAFCLCCGSGVRLAAAPLAVSLGGSSLARVVESGRHTTLKMWRSLGRAGSSPATGTCVLMGLRFGAPVFLCRRLTPPGVGGASGAVPVRLAGGATLAFSLCVDGVGGCPGFGRCR